MNQYAPYVDLMTKYTASMRDNRAGAVGNLSQGANAVSSIGMGLLAQTGSRAGQLITSGTRTTPSCSECPWSKRPFSPNSSP